MVRFMSASILFLVLSVPLGVPLAAASNTGLTGNPRPGYPHDTVNFHVMKGESGPKNCDGGHSLFLREYGGVIPETYIYISMVDWAQVDNDGDGMADEDPVDGVDNDGDGLVDEDDVEAGTTTSAIDCDAWGDGEVSLLIRDTDPRAGWISTQEWFLRAIGRPEENFAFTSYASQTVSCTVDPGPDGIVGTADDGEASCMYSEPDGSGVPTDWVLLADFNLAQEGCVKSVKLGGKNPSKGGGKTPFCDITNGFTGDVITADNNGDGVIDDADVIDANGDGVIDEFDGVLLSEFVFSVSCVDNLDTVDVDETMYCPLSQVVWDVDEEETTSRAKAQAFVSHTGSSQVKSGKIRK